MPRRLVEIDTDALALELKKEEIAKKEKETGNKREKKKERMGKEKKEKKRGGKICS